MNWKAPLAVFLTFVIADFIWLGSVMQSFYVGQIRGIGRIENDRFQVVYWAAFLAYLLMTFGICYFVLPKLGPEVSRIQAWLTGAAFGLVLFGVYDMTNYSILKDWTLAFSLADVAWGTVLCGIAAVVAKSVS